MSVAFASARPRGKGEVTQQTIQKMLDENHHLIQCILDHQSKGKTAECAQYQQLLHRNLVYLATIADSSQNMQSLLPAPPTQNMNLGPGALSQSGSSQGLHPQGSLSDAISTGLPPASLMQGQIGNGPNHVSMQQTAQSTLPTTSVSMSGSSHGTGPGYSHSGPASQSVPMQGQGAIGNYVSRTNINMQSNPVPMMHQQAATPHYTSAQGGSQHYQGQSSIAMMGQGSQGSGMMGQRPMAPYRPSQQGSSQQYLGQEEYYSEQYSHGQGATEPMTQQYYPDGHGDYGYQQSSYTEQSYDRAFEESTQHYYEGGNSQYSQQQAGYQQGTAQQQTYSQQQYPNQQSYPGQQQGYGPAQGALQYTSYQQGQGQQYGSYRASQTGPSAQQQRPYGYEQLSLVDMRTQLPQPFIHLQMLIVHLAGPGDSWVLGAGYSWVLGAGPLTTQGLVSCSPSGHKADGSVLVDSIFQRIEPITLEQKGVTCASVSSRASMETTSNKEQACSLAPLHYSSVGEWTGQWQFSELQRAATLPPVPYLHVKRAHFMLGVTPVVESVWLSACLFVGCRARGGGGEGPGPGPALQAPRGRQGAPEPRGLEVGVLRRRGQVRPGSSPLRRAPRKSRLRAGGCDRAGCGRGPGE
ncbi:LOW QUALITY PROTEIN: calcium-responsive transactivator [Thomomys bottae]